MPGFVVDTNLYVEAIQKDEGNAALARFQRRFAPFLYQHATVAQELLAGARTEAGYQELRDAWVAPFRALRRMIVPSGRAWTRAALAMVRLVERREMSPGGFRRSFLNDCLIAASASERGFVLVTRNEADFARIGTVLPGVRVVPPWPEAPPGELPSLTPAPAPAQE